jgi:hypothetical protein
MNAHALMLHELTSAKGPAWLARAACTRRRKRRLQHIDLRLEERPPLDMSWALYRLAPRV